MDLLNNVLDFYIEDRTQKRFEPADLSTTHIFVRGVNWGHIENRIYRRQPDGSIDIDGSYLAFNDKNYAFAKLKELSDEAPIPYVSSITRAILKKYGK